MNLLPEEALFLHSEIAVLKRLNGKVFSDKEISAALLIMHKKIFFEELEKLNLPRLSNQDPAEASRYSDFKTARIGMVPLTRQQRDELGHILADFHTRVSQRFLAQVEQTPALAPYYEKHPGLVSTPAHWYLSAVADTTALAAIGARMARVPRLGEVRTPREPIGLKQVDDRTIEEVAGILRATYALQGALEEQGLVKISGDNHTLSPLAVQILRRADDNEHIRTESDWQAYVHRRFKERFALELNEGQLLLLRRLYQVADSVAPAVFIKTPEPLNLAPLREAQHGVVAFDVTGQGAHNLSGTLQALKYAKSVVPNPTTKQHVNDALNLIDEEQMRRSDGFEEIFAPLAGILGGVFGEATPKIYRSGDDANSLPTAPVTAQTQVNLTRQMQPGGLSRLRATFQPQHYEDSLTPIDPLTRFTLISEAESFSRKLAEGLESDPSVSPEQLADTVFAIALAPHASGPVEFDVIVAPPEGGHPATWQKAIREATKRVLTTNPMPSHRLRRVIVAPDFD